MHLAAMNGWYAGLAHARGPYLGSLLCEVGALRAEQARVHRLCNCPLQCRRAFGGTPGCQQKTQETQHEQSKRSHAGPHVSVWGLEAHMTVSANGLRPLYMFGMKRHRDCVRQPRARLVDGRLELRLQQLQARLLIVGQVSQVIDALSACAAPEMDFLYVQRAQHTALRHRAVTVHC